MCVHLQLNRSDVSRAEVVQQWANCSVLRDSVVTAVPGYSTADPNIPELCGYARFVLGLPAEAATMPEALANAVFEALQLPGTAQMIALSTHDDPVLLGMLQARSWWRAPASVDSVHATLAGPPQRPSLQLWKTSQGGRGTLGVEIQPWGRGRQEDL